MYNTNAPTFPEHVDTEHFRATTIVLPAFAGSQIRNGPYGGISAPDSSTGETHAVSDTSLDVAVFCQSIEWIVEHNVKIRDALLASLVEHYNEMRELVIESLIDEDPDDVVPKIKNSNELLPLCGLVAVHLHSVSDNGTPEFGIELGCNWETEHGAGARFSGLEVKSAGEADYAFS